jgi:hypothetical protein
MLNEPNFLVIFRCFVKKQLGEKSREKKHAHREPHAGDGVEDENAGEVEEHMDEGDLVGLFHVVAASCEAGQ